MAIGATPYNRIMTTAVSRARLAGDADVWNETGARVSVAVMASSFSVTVSLRLGIAQKRRE